jgi:cell division transport system permease protein
MMLFRLISQGVRDLFRTPLSLATTVLSLTVVIFLGSAFLFVIYNLDRNIKASQGEVVFQIYWKPDAPKEAVFQHWSAIGEMPGVISLETFTPLDALNKLKDRFSIEENLSLETTLPYTALVYARIPEVDPRAWMHAMHDRLLALPGVEQVHYDPLRVDGAASWFAWSKRLFIPVAAVLLTLIALASGVAVRVTIAAKREELEILSLIGASPFFMRVPLVVSAATQGLLASLLALAMLYGIHNYLQNMLQGTLFAFSFLPQSYIFMCIGTVTLFSMLGSCLSFRQF